MEELPITEPAELAPEDYYVENGLMVFTAAYHLKRGYCCGSGCRHCPFGDWGPPAASGSQNVPPGEAGDGKG